MFPDKQSLIRRRDPSGSAEAGPRTPRTAGRGSDGRWKPTNGARVAPGAADGHSFQRKTYVTEADYDEEGSDGPAMNPEDGEVDAESAAEAYMQEGVDDGWTDEDYALEDIPEEDLLGEMPQEFWQDEDCAAAAHEVMDSKSVFTTSAVKLRGLVKARGFFPVNKGKGKGKGKRSKGRGRGKGNRGADAATVLAMAKKHAKPKLSPQEISERKKTSECGVCGQVGHWRGDPECPGPPGGKGNYAAIVGHEAQAEEEVDEGEPEWAPEALQSYNVPAIPFHSWLAVHEAAAPPYKPGVLNLRGGGGDSEEEPEQPLVQLPEPCRGRCMGTREDGWLCHRLCNKEKS